MTKERYAQIFCDHSPITDEEAADGWHFCDDWDNALIGRGLPEFLQCACLPASHPAKMAVAEHMPSLATEEKRDDRLGRGCHLLTAMAVGWAVITALAYIAYRWAAH